jgi:hypothetical protein
MGMPSHPRSKTLVIWIVLISILYLVASCGDDQGKEDATANGVEKKEPQAQQPIVKEWYPRSKYLPPQTIYAPAQVPLQQPMGQSQQPYYQGNYQQPQMIQQSPQETSHWYQPDQSQEMPQQYQTEPRYQTQQRPWGEFPAPQKKQKSATPQEQRPATMPYGGWQGYGGGYGGYGGYGYGLSDPLLGTPGWGSGIYNAYPDMMPPVYGW